MNIPIYVYVYMCMRSMYNEYIYIVHALPYQMVCTSFFFFSYIFVSPFIYLLIYLFICIFTFLVVIMFANMHIYCYQLF